MLSPRPKHPGRPPTAFSARAEFRSKRRWLTLAVVLATPLLLAIWLHHRHEQHDTWQGHTAVEWSMKLMMGNANERRQAEAALRTLGSKAVPSLCHAMLKPDSRARALGVRVARRLPATLRGWLFRNWLNDEPGTTRLAAAQALALLGPEAESAIPDLMTALSSPDSSVAWQASQTLGRIGTNALPALLPLLYATNQPLRLLATYTLSQIGGGATAAVPALVLALDSTNQSLRQSSIHALSRIWTNPAGQYSNLLVTERGPVREAAARAVRTLNQPPRRVQPLLVAMLRNNSASTRLAAIQGLGLLQGWTPATFAALCQARADQDPLVSSNALEVLAAPGVRTHMLPASLLEVAADTNSPFRWEAIQVLSLGGSNALPALPQLEALARGADERLRQAAAEALARISNSLHEPNPGK